MQRVTYIFFCLALFFASTFLGYSADRLRQKPLGSNGLNTFQENGKVGLKDEKGRILIPASYAAIGWSNDKLSTVDNVVGYKENGLWGLISLSNKAITSAEFQELIPADGSLLVARKKSPLSQRWSYGSINTSGKTIIPFLYDGLKISSMRAVVMVRDQAKFTYGLIDLSNKLLIPIQYHSIYSLGGLRFAVENFDRKFAIYTEDGKQVTDFSIDSISNYRLDYAIVYQNQRQGLIDRNGEMDLPSIYREIIPQEDGSVKMRQMDTWFFVDGQNKILNQYHADAIEAIEEGIYSVGVSGKVQLMNNSFKPIHDGYFNSVGGMHKGLATFRDATKKGLINRQGKIVLPAKFIDLIIDKQFFLASLKFGTKDRWIIMDSTGNTLTEKHYEEILPHSGKYFPVRNGNFWGAVNRQGKEFVACVHDSLLQQNGNHIVVKFKGKYGVIDLDERWIITPQDNRLTLADNERYFEYSGKTTFLKSLTGNIIYFSDNLLEFKTHYLLEHLPSGAFWIIDLNGIIIDRSYQPEHTDQIFQASEGMRAIRKDGKYGFIDDRGRLRIANRYDEAKPFSDGLAAIKIRNKWGFIDEQENIVVQPVYDDVSKFQNGHAVVKLNSYYGLVARSGKLILPSRYDEITLTKENRFLLKQNGFYGMADERGAVIINPKYNEVIDTGNGYVIARRNDKYGLLTLQGLSTIPMIYDSLSYDRHHGQYLAVKKALWEAVKF